MYEAQRGISWSDRAGISGISDKDRGSRIVGLREEVVD